MKPYETYQHLDGETMTSRDLKQIDSKFWGKGKWNNFIRPFLPKDCKGLDLVDMGCNAGLFLKFAQDLGFERIIGVDSNKESVERGMSHPLRQKYKIIEKRMEDAIDDLPIVDYTILANAHYYFNIVDWVNYVEKLKFKSKYVIIVTAEKRHINRCWTQAGVGHIRGYFRDWKEVGFINELPTEGDPDPRRMWSLCFESPYIDKVDTNSLDTSNHTQYGFYTDIDDNKKNYHRTKYYLTLRTYRTKMSKEQVEEFVEDKIKTYFDIKDNGQKNALLVDRFKKNWVLEGNHRCRMLWKLNRKAWVRLI